MTLPMREMVLYKHGVGFFVRAGNLAGESLELSFRQEEINDVLKSLAVFDLAGGQVRGIHYQTPMDMEARTASSSIHLRDHGSLRDLLRDLRGREAALTFETVPGSEETLQGRIIGLDDSAQDHSQVEEDSTRYVTLLLPEGDVRVFRLDALRRLQLLDGQARQDLAYFLDTRRGEDNRRSVTVRLSAGEHDLRVYYVAPSPTWRVTYRFVAAAEEEGSGGRALLQGWGLFDNRLEEDLEDVRVSLVAGQPISFIYDLYASRIPHRPVVQDVARIAPGPIEYDNALDAPPPEMQQMAASATPQPTLLKRIRSATGDQRAEMAKQHYAMPSMETLQQGVPPDATGREAGEFFQYEVTTPVSVKRGESALVPILGEELQYGRELLYNGSKLPKHPVAALRFSNSSGLTLERGPVTIVENGDYKGEAVLPFTKAGAEVYLPYAVELSVRVTEQPDTWTETHGLDIRGEFAVYQNYKVLLTRYLLENSSDQPKTVFIEVPMMPNGELFDMPPPDLSTATEQRWQVEVPAHGQAEFQHQVRWLQEREQHLRQLRYQQLHQFMEEQWLDEATLARLSQLLGQLDTIQRAEAALSRLETEREELHQQQGQLRPNLQTLQASGKEADLRDRMLAQLGASQVRLEEIDTERSRLRAQISAAEAQAQQIIDGLGAADA